MFLFFRHKLKQYISEIMLNWFNKVFLFDEGLFYCSIFMFFLHNRIFEFVLK